MSIFTSIIGGLSKFESFIVKVLGKTSQVIAVLQKVTPSTIAAILAVFYDITKAVATVEVDYATRNLADILSPQTQALLKQFVADVKALESTAVSDAQALNLAITGTIPTPPVA